MESQVLIFDSQLQEMRNHLSLLYVTTEEEFESLYQQVTHKIKNFSKMLLMKISEVKFLMSSESKTDQISQFSLDDLEMQHQVHILFHSFSLI